MWGMGEDVSQFQMGELVFGHSQPVLCVRWLAGGMRLLSIGGADQCVLQWRVEGNIEGAKKHAHRERQMVEAAHAAAQKRMVAGLWGVSDINPYDSYRLHGKPPRSKAAPAQLDAPEKMTEAARSYVDAREGREGELGTRHQWKERGAGEGDESQKSGSSAGSRASAGGRKARMNGAPATDGERFAVCRSSLFSDSRWREKVGHHQAPESRLELEWVNGYHGHDSYVWLTDPDKPDLTGEAGRGNLFFIADATGAVDGRYIAFFVSALGVVMDTTERRQFFFVGHDAEVSSMALHPARSLLATGQVASHGSQLPPIFVWSPSVVVANQEDRVASRRRAPQKEVEAELVGFCEQKINLLCFSADGAFLMAIGQDSSHRFACYKWKEQTILFKGMAGNADLFMISSLPSGFAVCGNKEIKVWEHPGLGSTATTDAEGGRWMCGLAPLGPVLVECIVVIDDPGSACGKSIVCGWPDGHILLFQQFQDDDKVEWVLGDHGSRYWLGHPNAAITCLAYAAPDEFCHSQGCHHGMLLSGDSMGDIKVWKIEPRPEKFKRKSKVPEPWEEISALGFSLYRYHDTLHPRGPVARGKPSSNDPDSMVDVCVNPIDPPVALRLCAHRLDYLPNAAGKLLIGTSANSVVSVVLEDQLAEDYELDVILEGHTGNLRAMATMTAASLSFCVGFQIQDRSLAVIAEKIDVGHSVKEVVMQKFPQFDTPERVEHALEQGKLIVSRWDKEGKLWLSFECNAGGGGGFVEQSSEQTLFIWNGPSEAEMEDEGSDAIKRSLSLSLLDPEGRMTQGRAKVTILRKMACEVQRNFKPNIRYAKLMGGFMVDVRTVEYETDPMSLPKGASRKLKMRRQKVLSNADRERALVAKGDIFTLVGSFDVPMQAKLRAAVSQLVGVAMSSVVVQKADYKQQMPRPDPKDGLIKSLPEVEYHVMVRVLVPLEKEAKANEVIRDSLGARKVSHWVLVRNLVRKGNFKIEASGIRVRGRTRNKDEFNAFELALDKQGISGKAFPVQVSRWKRESAPRTVYLTCGEDSILRAWDAIDRRCVATRDLGCDRVRGCFWRVRRRAVCMTVSPVGAALDQWLAIGYQGGLVSLHHMDALMAPPLLELHDREEDITDVKFAPMGSILAVASAERTIDLYAKWLVPNDLYHLDYDPGAANFVLQRIAVCRGHAAAVTHMDFSDDAVYLRSNDASGEVLFWSILDPAGAGHTVHSILPDDKWATKVVSRDLAVTRPLLHKAAATIDVTTGLKNQRFLRQGARACGTRVVAPAELRSLDWASSSCPLAWSLRAIWRPRAALGDIPSVARSTHGDVVACGYVPVSVFACVCVCVCVCVCMLACICKCVGR